MRRALLVLPLFLFGCQPADDDDDTPTPGPTGEAPVLQSVTVCEVANSRDTCRDQGVDGALRIAFDINVTDVDGDLDNPQYFILLNEQTPWLDGRYEGNLGDGGRLRVQLGCNYYALGADLPWRFAIRDAEGNESEEAVGSFPIADDDVGPNDPGACPPLM